MDWTYCVLCASGEHRPEYHNIWTTNLFGVVIGDDELSLSVVEYYRIIDEQLPREDRFETVRYVLRIHGDLDKEEGELAEVEINKAHALRLAQVFLNTAAYIA